jgi:triacylglycerol lipase
MGPLVSQLRGFGLAFTPEQIEKTRALYAPHVPKPTPDIANVARNLAYGPHERHRLDVFSPLSANGAPVVMFVHGGGFVMGDKGGPDDPFFNNIGAWAAKNGFVAVTITYRLAPDHKYPAGGQDVAASVRWVRDNIAAHGGDPEKIVLIGHSAGGAHVGCYIGHPDLKAGAARSLKGAVLISAIHDVQHADQNHFQKAYYGEDPSAWPGQSSVPGLAETDIPLLVTLSEFDPPEFHRLAALVVDARARAKGAWPAFFWMAGHNHVSPSMQIGCAEDTLGPRVVEAMTGPNGWLAA